MNPKKRKALLEHLTQYKRNAIGVQEDGREKKWNTPRSYILPEECQDLNLLELCRGILHPPSFRLHDGFHHLNSSQAMCINLFSPLKTRERLRLLLRHIGFPDAPEPRGTFEKESDIERVTTDKLKTSFDLQLAGDGVPETCVEVKYTETGFGSGRKGTPQKLEERRQKIEHMYRGLVERSKFFADKETSCDTEFWLTNYQLMRNLVHINVNTHLVMLFPSWNTNVGKQADYATTLLTPEGRSRLHIVHLEKFVGFLESNVMDDAELTKHYAEFRRKYLPELSVA